VGSSAFEGRKTDACPVSQRGKIEIESKKGGKGLFAQGRGEKKKTPPPRKSPNSRGTAGRKSGALFQGKKRGGGKCSAVVVRGEKRGGAGVARGGGRGSNPQGKWSARQRGGPGAAEKGPPPEGTKKKRKPAPR